MALVAALQLLYYCLASISHTFYQQHRTACTVVIQSLQLALAVAYIPAASQIALGSQLAAGKEAALAGNAVVTGVATFHITMHSIAGRLHFRHAASFVLLKVAASLYFLLGKQVQSMSISAVGAVVSAMKQRVDCMYNVALAAATVSGCWPLPDFKPPPSANTCFTVWLHLCVAGLIPLYFIAVHDSSTASSSNGQRSGPLQQQQQQQQCPAAGCSTFLVSMCMCARHCASLFGSSMLIWATIDSIASLQDVNLWIKRNESVSLNMKQHMQ
jgi:hypothetical protein